MREAAGLSLRMSYTCLNSVTRVASKRYHCIWCGQSIDRGEKYVYEAGVYCGDFQDQHWHPECIVEAQRTCFAQGEEDFTPWENQRPMDAFDPGI